MAHTELDQLPTVDGFRQRGLEMTRIETFTDAGFAFALTLLVMSSSAPHSLPELQDLLRDIPVFVFGAANLMIFWQGHNEWSRRYGLDDFGTMILSVAFVVSILIYVYPLRFVGSLFVGTIGRVTGLPVGHPLPDGFKVQDVNTSFVIYGAGFITCALVVILLNLHAWRQRAALELNSTEIFMLKSELGAWAVLCCVGLISVGLAIVMPNTPGSPGMAYMLLAVVMPGFAAVRNRQKARLTP